jgi:molybdopterin-guanine dinucleotide biosynthesis protein A
MRNKRAVVVACDMPFLNLPFLRYMALVAPSCDVVVPRIGEYLEPLHAVYSARCVKPIEMLLAEGPKRVAALFHKVSVYEVNEDKVRLFDAELSFFNVNTPQDWDRAQQLSSKE